MFAVILYYGVLFLYKSKGALGMYIKSIRSLFKRMGVAKREVMNAAGMQYLHQVKARLWY